MKIAKTILLVDDDEKLLRSFERHFSDSEFEILTAISAAEALVLLNHASVDAIVSDNQMTGTNGTRLLATVSKKYPHVLRYMLTGDISKSQAWLVENEIGVCRLFEKPCEPQTILSVIEAQLAANAE